MDETISKLINNISPPRNIETINIVCDSGAYNGGYLYGMLLYMAELENKKYIQIDKISGTSIGSLLGTCFILNKLPLVYTYMTRIIACYRRSHCLRDFKGLVQELIQQLDENDYQKLNNRMFINYYDIHQCKEVIQSTYTSNKDIEKYILNSTFIPFFMNGQYSNDGYIDGASPYIFNERTVDDTKILFFKLTQYGKLKNMLHIRGELNFEQRIIEGILDVHEFYMKQQPTIFCSWVNHWKLQDYIVFRIRRILWLIVVCILYVCSKCKSYIPSYIITKCTSNRLFSVLSEHLTYLYKDLFVLFYNS
jgi:hypothetical protein